jgi:uncharacterized phage protein (TIGR02218 family)
MKTATAALQALLDGTRQFQMADCYTIATVGGEVPRYTSADFDVKLGAYTFSSRGPLVSRGPIRTSVGLEVDTLSITIATGNPAHALNGQPFIAGALDGALDGALVLLERAFFSSWASPAVGSLVMFSGRVSQISGSRHELQVSVKSDLELLNVKLPRNIVTPGCSNTLYGSVCGANRAAVTVTGAIAGVETQRRAFGTALSQANGWFDLGTLTFTSGANAGVSRTVQSFADGTFEFALAWPADIAVGDAFSVVPGCDGTKATCQVRFNNLPRYRGFPFVPAPETIT